MSDLIERLRRLSTQTYISSPAYLAEAADELERLEARVEEAEKIIKTSDVLLGDFQNMCDRQAVRIAELEKTNRWLRSLAFISHTDHYEKPPYQWTITFKSSCTTIENALKQALKD